MLKQNINMVINSNKEVFIFKLLENGEIVYHHYGSSLGTFDPNKVIDKDITQYSAIIDNKDVIHLVCLNNMGELIHHKCIDGKWSKSIIANFDLKSNIYNQIEILIVNDKLNLLYNYSNRVNSHIWTIQHIIYDEIKVERHNAIRYITKKNPDQFFLDVDSQGTIHLLYRTDLNIHSQIYHIFYSPYTKTWPTVPRQISSDNIKNLNPFLFIDSVDNLHGLLLEETNNKYQIKYLRMSSTGKEKYIWKEVNLPYILASNFPPIILEENNELKILCPSDNSLGQLLSTNYGNSWVLGSTIGDKVEDISMIKFSSNLLPQNNKANHIYCNPSDLSSFSFQDIYPDIEETPHLIEALVEEEESIVQNIDTEVISNSIDFDLNILNEIDDKLNQLLDNYKEFELHRSIIIDNQITLNHRLDAIQNSPVFNKPSLFSKIFNVPK